MKKSRSSPPRQPEPRASHVPGYLASTKTVRTSSVLAESLVAGTLVAVGCLILGPDQPYAAGSFNDDGVYLALGKAIADGEGYRSIHLVGSPVQVKYPPGAPVLFAGVWKLVKSLPEMLLIVSFLHALVLGTAAALIYWVGRARVGIAPLPLLAFPILAFFFDSALQYSSLATSEPWFILSWACVLALFYATKAATTRPIRIALALLLGLLFAAMTLIRTMGIVLIPVALVALIVERVSGPATLSRVAARGKRKRAPVERPWLVTSRSGAEAAVACFAGVALPLLGWRIWHGRQITTGPVSLAPDEVSYVQWLGVDGVGDFANFLRKTSAWNSGEYAEIMVAYLSPIPDLSRFVLVVLALLTVVGGIRLLREHSILPLTALAAGALVLVWPWVQDRLLLTILPFVGLLTAYGLDPFMRFRDSWGKSVVDVLLVFFIAGFAFRQLGIRSTPPDAFPAPSSFLPVRSSAIAELSGWVEQSTTLEDRILVHVPAAIYLYTGRRTASSAPAQSSYARSIYAVPGKYLAQSVLRDSLTIVIAHHPEHSIAKEVAAVRKTCPNVLQPMDARDQPRYRRFYRVRPNPGCLGQLVTDPLSP